MCAYVEKLEFLRREKGERLCECKKIMEKFRLEREEAVIERDSNRDERDYALSIGQRRRL